MFPFWLFGFFLYNEKCSGFYVLEMLGVISSACSLRSQPLLAFWFFFVRDVSLLDWWDPLCFSVTSLLGASGFYIERFGFFCMLTERKFIRIPLKCFTVHVKQIVGMMAGRKRNVPGWPPVSPTPNSVAKQNSWYSLPCYTAENTAAELWDPCQHLLALWSEMGVAC